GFQYHACATLLEQRSVANELDRIANALLGSNKDRLAGERLTTPRWNVEARSRSIQQRSHPTRLVLHPAIGESSSRQQCDRIRVMAVEVGPSAQIAFHQFQGPIEFALVA